jgi:hypothetical protein
MRLNNDRFIGGNGTCSASGAQAGDRLWEGQFSDEYLVIVRVGLPSGIFIEHRLFSYISLNRAGKPLHSFETMLAYI